MLIVPRESSTGTEHGPAPCVAVVHSSPLYQAVFSGLLSSAPVSATVTPFSRSDQALAAVDAGGFDLVVCGLRTEPISGTAVVETLRNAGGPPVALIADPEDADNALRALRLGAAGVLTVDVSQREFVEGMQAMLRGHSVMSTTLAERSLSRAPRSDDRAPAVAAYRQLSSTEREILLQLGRAISIEAIAAGRGITKKTVRNHVASIYRKLALRSRSEAILWVARMGLGEDTTTSAELAGGATAWAPVPNSG